MTREQFIDYWCTNAGITAEDLKRHGLIALPCNCGQNGCQGWQITTHLVYLWDPEALRALPQEYQDEIEAMGRTI